MGLSLGSVCRAIVCVVPVCEAEEEDRGRVAIGEAGDLEVFLGGLGSIPCRQLQELRSTQS